MKESEWGFDGYETDSGCDICGQRPAKTEPRFLYSVCKYHSTMTAVEVSQTTIKMRIEDRKAKNN